MAYNSYFPMGYQQPIPSYNTMPQTPSAPQNTGQSGILWVQGIEGAKAYPVATGNSVLLMDSEESVFYVKSSDASGMPMPLRVFDYKERTAQQTTNDYVTREEFDRQIEELTKKIRPPKKKEKADE